MPPITVLEGGQSGLTVDEIVQQVADEWGGPVASSRFSNRVKRRINRVLRDIHLYNPKLPIFTVVGADVTLQAGVSEYDVTLDVDNGGFGWTNCVEVLDLVFNSLDNRPLEKIDLERWRERSELLSEQGPPMSWFAVDKRRVYITPAPDQAYTGVGDYRSDMPEVTSGQLAWPRSWDECLLSGVHYFTAMTRLRENPSGLRAYEQRYETQKALIEWDSKTTPKPQPAIAVRDLRSPRFIHRDNSRDDRRWR